MLLAFSKSNDSPCFVKIAIFRQKEAVTPQGWLLLFDVGKRDSNHVRTPVNSLISFRASQAKRNASESHSLRHSDSTISMILMLMVIFSCPYSLTFFLRSPSKLSIFGQACLFSGRYSKQILLIYMIIKTLLNLDLITIRKTEDKRIRRSLKMDCA